MTGPLRISITLLAALLIVLLPWAVIGELPGERWLSGADHDAALFGATGSALLGLDVLLPVPSSLVLTGLGARLGLGWGWLCAWLGLTAGSLVGYGLGRLYPGRFAAHLPETPTLALLFVSRPVPVLAEVGALSAGACRVPALPFTAACAAGNACYAAALCANGALWLPGEWPLAALFPAMLVPALGWWLWRRARPCRHLCRHP